MQVAKELQSILDTLDNQLTSLTDTRRQITHLCKLMDEYPDGAIHDILSLKEFVRQEPDLSGGLNAMRWQIQREHQALVDCGAVVRRGNRILINRPRYIEYLMARRVG
jgi:hypothetical protein